MAVVWSFAEHSLSAVAQKNKRLFDMNTGQNVALLEKDCGFD